MELYIKVRVGLLEVSGSLLCVALDELDIQVDTWEHEVRLLLKRTDDLVAVHKDVNWR